MTPPLPAGFRLVLDESTRQLSADSWFGGSPARIVRLTPAGRQAWDELAAGPVTSKAAGVLARRLTDAGLAHPRPPEPGHPPDVTVVVPVHDRVEKLVHCLAAMSADGHPVVLVDDASRDPDAVARLADRFGARLVVRPVNGGPAAARNSGIGAAGTELVAFVDSDCVPPAGWITALAKHFSDPLVAAAAPRILPVAPNTWAGNYTRATFGLDLGASPASVAPNTRVAWAPTAALVARRAALLGVARHGEVLDPTLSVAGEDVDLVWRLHEAGWRIRYDPTVHVRHLEPETWKALLHRRFRYGTSAAPLAIRHPGRVPPLVLFGLPTVTVAAALARRPALAAAVYAGSVLATLRRQPVPGAARVMVDAVFHTWQGIGRYGTQYALPLLAVAAVRGRHRAAIASLVVGPALAEWLRGRKTLDPVRFVLGRLADDVAYGAGVWAGSHTHRTTAALIPQVRWRLFRRTR